MSCSISSTQYVPYGMCLVRARVGIGVRVKVKVKVRVRVKG